MENICKEGMPHKWFLALKVIFPVGLGKNKISCFAHLWVGCWVGNAYFSFFVYYARQMELHSHWCTVTWKKVRILLIFVCFWCKVSI